MNNNSFVFGDRFNIAVEDIEGVEDVFDENYYSEITVGKKGTAISWGNQNKLPYGVTRAIATDEVMSQNKLFNVQSLYGLGLKYVDKNTGVVSDVDEIRDFCLTNSFPSLFLEQCTDMKYFYMSAMLIVLSNDKTKIVKVHHLDACNIRFEKADAHGKINHIFYGNWEKGDYNKIVRYPLLSMKDPISDIMIRTGKERNNLGEKKSEAQACYAIVTKFPTPGFAYYPVPYYMSVFKSKWFEIKQLAATYKKAKLKNLGSIRYVVSIHKSYWEEQFIERGITNNPEKQKEVRAEIYNNLKTFVTGVENSGKMWITGSYTSPDGKQISQIFITKIDDKTEGGDFSEENQEACNMICYADGIHPNMVGAVPGKSQMNNSGSDKRELFTLKQSLETPFRDIMLIPHELIIRFNGWQDKVRPVIPMALLTTLDKHADSVTVTKNA